MIKFVKYFKFFKLVIFFNENKLLSMILFTSKITLKLGYDHCCYSLFFHFVLLCTCRFRNRQRLTRLGSRVFCRGPRNRRSMNKKIYKHRWLWHVRRTNRRQGFIILHKRKSRLNAGPDWLPDASTGTVFGNNVFQTTDVHIRLGRKSNSNRLRQRWGFTFLFLFLLVLFVRFSPRGQSLHTHIDGCYTVPSATSNRDCSIRRPHQFFFRGQRQT